jgi:putative RecB family exonuclease
MQLGDWRPSTSALCQWCAHQALCPAWGGTPPPLPALPEDAIGALRAGPGAAPDGDAPRALLTLGD